MGWLRNFGKFMGGAAQAAPGAAREVVGALEKRRERQDEQDTMAFKTALEAGDEETMKRLQQNNPRMGNLFGSMTTSAGVAATDEEKQAFDELTSIQQQYNTATTEQEIANLQQQETKARSRVTAAQQRLGRLKPGTKMTAAPVSGYKGAASRVSATRAGRDVAAYGIQAINSGADDANPQQTAKDYIAFQFPGLDPVLAEQFSTALGASLTSTHREARAKALLARQKDAAEIARDNAQAAAARTATATDDWKRRREELKDFMATAHMMDPEKAKKMAVGLELRPEAVEFLTLNNEALADPNPKIAQTMIGEWRRITGLPEGQDDQMTRALMLRSAMNQRELNQQAAWFIFQQEVEAASSLSDATKIPAALAKARQNYAAALDEVVQGQIAKGAPDAMTVYQDRIKAAKTPLDIAKVRSSIQNDRDLSPNQKETLLTMIPPDTVGSGSIPYMGPFAGVGLPAQGGR